MVSASPISSGYEPGRPSSETRKNRSSKTTGAALRCEGVTSPSSSTASSLAVASTRGVTNAAAVSVPESSSDFKRSPRSVSLTPLGPPVFFISTGSSPSDCLLWKLSTTCCSFSKTESNCPLLERWLALPEDNILVIVPSASTSTCLPSPYLIFTPPSLTSASQKLAPGQIQAKVVPRMAITATGVLISISPVLGTAPVTNEAAP